MSEKRPTGERLACGCCGRDEDRCRLRRLTKCHELYRLPPLMCHDCFSTWYDGETDPDAIKARVLAGASP